MHSEWMAFEHNRIHVMERWQDGPTKEAGLASARSALDRVIREMPEGSSFACVICASRRQNVIVVPDALRAHRRPSTLAA